MHQKTPFLFAALLASVAFAGCVGTDLPVGDASSLLPADPTSLLTDASLDGIMNLHLLDVAGGAFTLIELDDALVLLDDTSGLGDADAEVLAALGGLGVSEVDQIVRTRADVRGAPACRDLFSGISPDKVVAAVQDDAVAIAEGCAAEAADVGNVMSLAQAAPDNVLALGGDVSADVLHLNAAGGAGIDGALLKLTHGDVSALVPGSLACSVDAVDLPVAIPSVDILPVAGALGPVQDACGAVIDAASPALTVVSGPVQQARGLLSSLLDLTGPLGLPVHAATGADHVVISSDGVDTSILEMTDVVPLGMATGAADSVLPTVEGWAADPTSVAPGDVVTLTMTLKDEASGIKAAAFGLLPPGADVDPDALVGKAKANAKEVVWTVQYTVPADAPAGVWEMAFVTAKDAAGNAAVKDIGAPAFTVLDTVESTGSGLIGWSLGMRELAQGEALELAFAAADVPTHLSTVEAAVRDPTGTVHEAMSLRAIDDAAGKTDLVWALDLPVDAPLGAWELVSATGKDAQGNALSLVPRDAGDQVFAVVPDARWLTDMAPDTSSFSITNPQGTAQDLSGWAIETTNGVRYQIPDGTSLPAGGELVVYATSGADTAQALYADLEGQAWGTVGGLELVSTDGIVDALAL